MNDFISKTGNPKTSNIDKPTIVKGDVKQKSSSSQQDGSFDKILTNQLDKTKPTDILNPSSTLSEIQSPFKIPLEAASFDPAKYSQKVAASLDLLETYAAFLNDPEKTLKEASGLLDQLLNQTHGLKQEFDASNASNSDLKEILNHLLTTVTIEKIKLDRGDYLN